MLEGLKKNLGSDGRSRGTTKKIIAFIAFGAIILVFVFLGMAPDQLGQSGGGAVAQVNNVTISIGQFRSQVERMERQFGGNNSAFSQFIRRQALESLIDQEVFFQTSQNEGLLVSDEEVRDVILNIDAFKENGRFQPSRYEAILRNNRLSVPQFEMGIKKDAANDRVRRLVTDAMIPSSGEIRLQNLAKTKKTNLSFISFSKEELIEKLAKKVKYDGVVDPKIAKQVEENYKTNISKYTQKEEVKAQHILIKTDGKNDAEALKKIKEIAAQANSSNFKSLAEKHSEDAGSKKSGGDLGFFARGQMVKAFEDTAFSMKVGEISEPVKSQFGYHLIMLNEKKEAKVQPLEEVRDDVTKKVLAAEQVDQDVVAIEKAMSEGLEDEIKKFVSQYELNWSESGVFDLTSETVPTIGASEELLGQAFTLRPSAPFAKSIFRINGKSFIVKFAAVKEKEETKAPVEEDKLNEQLAASQSDDAFRRLRDQWKNSAEIFRNSQYLGDSQTM